MRLALTTVRLGTNGGAFGGRRRCVCRPSKEKICKYKASVGKKKISQMEAPTRGKVSPGRPTESHGAPRIHGGVTMDVTHSGWGSGHPRALSRGTNAPSNAPSRWPAQKRRAEHAARPTRIVALDGTTAAGPPVSMANWEHKSRETTENECTPTPTKKHTPCTASRERAGFV